MRFYILYVITLFFLSSQTTIVKADPEVGFSPLHELKYKKGFQHFAYVNPKAPKGGKIRVGRRGTFNSLNFLKYPGRTPATRNELPIDLTNYLYDTLLVESSDEIAGYYNLLASKVIVASDYGSVEFTIRPEAVWHDGRKISAEDIIFTFNTLKKQGPPFFRQVFRTISVKKLAEDRVIFTNKRKGDREFVRIVGSIPIHPKHYWDKADVTKTTLNIPLASGAYKIIRANPGRLLTLKRVEDYWGKKLAVNTGFYNFDEIILTYYRDNTSALEGFKANQYDVRLENSALSWANAYNGDNVKSGKIKKTETSSKSPGNLVRMVFNVRRDIFKDRRVRKALALIYDFEDVNKKLFHGKYEQVISVYGSTILAAKGKATGEEHSAISEYLDILPKGIEASPSPDWKLKEVNERERLRIASKLLKEAGYKLVDGKLVDEKTSKPIILSVAFVNPAHLRFLGNYANSIKRLGIKLDFSILEPISASQKLLNHDYDLAILRSKPEMATGPREGLLWGSRFADVKKSYAFAGVKDKVIDGLVNKMKNAKSLSAMVSATRAFDRVMRWQVYEIPLWAKSKDWVASWNRFGQPEAKALYQETFINRWWYVGDKLTKNIAHKTK